MDRILNHYDGLFYPHLRNNLFSMLKLKILKQKNRKHIFY